MVADKELRADISLLGEFLGEIIREQAGKELFDLEEHIRRTAKRGRQKESGALEELMQTINDLDSEESLTIIKAFSLFFDLANLAEDVHRVRILRERERETYPKPRSESIGAAIKHLKHQGYDAAALADLFSSVAIKPVFTAHPTEAKRTTVRNKLHRIREYLTSTHNMNLLPREKEEYHKRIRAEISGLWQSDLLHQRRPKVLDEVKWGLGFMDSLWEVIPNICRDLDRELDYTFPEAHLNMAELLEFGSWIGGDRDGNPYVTADVTEQTLQLHRDRALELHLATCRELYDRLSTSSKQVSVDDQLVQAIQSAAEQWDAVAELLESIPDSEVYRQWIRVIFWRLQQTQSADTLLSLPDGSYHNEQSLLEDIQQMADSLEQHQGHRLVEGKLQDWLNQTRIFGLHLMRLDIREDAARFGKIVGEILERSIGLENFRELSEEEKRKVLTENTPHAIEFEIDALSDDAADIVTLFQMLGEVEAQLGPEWIGDYIMSMTHHLSDILVVLWLGKLTGLCQCGKGKSQNCPFTVVPLFETVEDLENAPRILDEMFANPWYTGHLANAHTTQTVMIGYSDSTKDGGYLSANWNLYHSQQEMTRTAEKNNVRLNFFHGRGGTLGRGGGPAARSILSLPPEAVQYGLSMTEQGEILAERYGEPSIAHRHLEQIIWATLLVDRQEKAVDRKHEGERQDILEQLATDSFDAYKSLINEDGFLQYFEEATPIAEVENLPIGSRPAHRGGERNLGNLRAIPWVFSWTQNRHFLPAWYGFGTAMEAFIERSGNWENLSHLYQNWPFFKAVLDNATLALKKTDLGIGAQYHHLMENSEQAEQIWNRIEAEYHASLESIKQITGQTKLLDTTPWLRHSINIRNPYVDPLNLLQIEWLRRKRDISEHASEYNDDVIEEMLRYTIQGVASGLRSTG